LLVLAIGVLGAARAQLAAMQTRQTTGLLSSGVQLAGALAERMRANAPLLRAADTFNPYLAFDYDAMAHGAPALPGTMCFARAECDSAQMAAFDLYEIAQAVHANFPGGRVTVCRDAAIVTGRTAALAWPCVGGPDAPIVIKLGWRTKGDQASDQRLFAPSVAIVAGGAAS
ncbi:MAG: type IV pilus modification protein PilV, partial [Telluria sp.]